MRASSPNGSFTAQRSIVEAIEDEFVPLLVYNNKPEDEEILKAFDEPAWNNPVVRFLDSRGGDWIERQDGVYESPRLAERMGAALQAAGRPVPGYLSLVGTEIDFDSRTAAEIGRATFAMHCFWEGEAKLGSVPGVLDTRAVWVDGMEGVDVAFDTRAVSFRPLVEQAKSLGCTTRVFARNDEQIQIARELVGDRAVWVAEDFAPRPAGDAEQKYYLRHSPYANLPLSGLQAVRMNSLLGSGSATAAAIDGLLSPRQRARK
jgi:hypothetical protein